MQKVKKLLSVSLCLVMMCVCLCACYEGTDRSSSEVSRYADTMQPYGGTLVDTQYRTVEYTYREEESYVNPYKVPTYNPSMPGSCAVEAGGNAIVYFDRLYDELIPGYAPKYIWGGFTYGAHNDAISNMFSTVYNLMGTTEDGTSVAGFKSGMKNYVNSKGRSLDIIDAVGNYNNTNIDYIKNALKQEKLAVIFLDTYSVTAFGGFETHDGYDTISHYVCTGCHTMLVYGYHEFYYFDRNRNLITRDTYFYVATGFVTCSLGLINIRDFCNIDDVFVINVF